MEEAAEMIKIPDEHATYWAARGYYGSVKHDIKAVWNFYLGYFDGNPSRLDALPPADAGPKFVEYMGGADAVIEKAKADFDEGNYRWVAQVLDKVVMAEPDNQDAKDLLADALEQMGYQAESGPWRNFYLSGAKELRDGIMQAAAPNTASPDTIKSMPLTMFLDFLAVHVNGERAAGKQIFMNFAMTDTKESYGVALENGVLNYYTSPFDNANVSLSVARSDFNDVMLGQTTLKDPVDSGKASLEGDAAAFDEFRSTLDTFEFWWPIVTPKEAM